MLGAERDPELRFRSALGIIRLAKSYGPDRADAACRCALEIRSPSYRCVQAVLKHALDRNPLPVECDAMPPTAAARSPVHEHVRGRAVALVAPRTSGRRTRDARRRRRSRDVSASATRRRNAAVLRRLRPGRGRTSCRRHTQRGSHRSNATTSPSYTTIAGLRQPWQRAVLRALRDEAIGRCAPKHCATQKSHEAGSPMKRFHAPPFYGQRRARKERRRGR